MTAINEIPFTVEERDLLVVVLDAALDRALAGHPITYQAPHSHITVTADPDDVLDLRQKLADWTLQ